jgi:2-C-methyl-D-erythritol 4-phosphate cytidylyltransferase
VEQRRQARFAGLLVAAGRGARFGADEPKQFLSLGGVPLLVHAARTLNDSPIIEELHVAVPAGWEDRVRELLEAAGILQKLRAIVPGGATRQDSVSRGLEPIVACSHVLIHDAARPFLTERLIQAAVSASERHGAATVALPVSDTLFRGEVASVDEEAVGSHAVAPIPRDGVWSVQTPQVFELELIREAHRHARSRNLDATDDGTLVLELGRRVELVRGNWWNIKVTRPEDLLRAEAILAMRDKLIDAEEEA